MFNLFKRKQNGIPPANALSAASNDESQPRKPYAVAFIDYEHWYISLERMYHTKPDIRKWRNSLAEKFDVGDIIFFGDFSNPSLRADIPRIREITSYIIETQNASSHFEKDFTDFIMLDHIYQKAVTDEAIDVFIIFSGDGHFSSVASFITNRVGKQVGVYAVKGALSTQLRNSANWAEEVAPTPAASSVIRVEHVGAARHAAEEKPAEPKKAEVKKTAAKAEAKAEAKADVKKAEEKPEKKKAAGKSEDKKAEDKAEDKKSESKKAEDKAEDKKAESKKAEKAKDKKSEAKKAEDKAEDKKSEAKKAEDKAEDKKAEGKAEVKKSENRKIETKKAEAKKAEAVQSAQPEPEAEEKAEAPAAKIRVKVSATEKLKPSKSADAPSEDAPKADKPKPEEDAAVSGTVSAKQQKTQSQSADEGKDESAPLPDEAGEAASPDEAEAETVVKRRRRRRRSHARSAADQPSAEAETEAEAAEPADTAETAAADEGKTAEPAPAPAPIPEQTQEALPDEPAAEAEEKSARADTVVSLTVGSQMILKNLDYIDNQNKQRDADNRQAALPTFWGTVEVVSRLNHVEKKCILDSMHYLLSKGYVYQESVQIDDKDVKTLRVDWEKSYGLYQRN